MNGLHLGGTGRAGGPLRQSGSLPQLPKDGGGGLPSMLHGWRTIVSVIHEEEDGGGSIFPRETVGAGEVPIVCGRLGDGIYDGT